ncbi:hypothetical protein M405DRAFT_810725 [Rhizopogon salebrosus TDB-379]|nr:hypothetical protein M405DRAFT_810725 [Rhizopogon salebrosus TDB-379]
MPLFFHNWKEIVDLWKDTLDTSDDEALTTLLEFARGPFAPSATTYIRALPYSTPSNSIRNIQVPARAVNQTRPLRPDMVFFSSSTSNLQS